MVNMYMLFVDFEKAFDSVNRNKMWEVFRKYRIPNNIVELIKNMYESFTCQIVYEGLLFKLIAIEARVSQ